MLAFFQTLSLNNNVVVFSNLQLIILIPCWSNAAFTLSCEAALVKF